MMILLFGLPIGSYYYLQKGYQFRKNALIETQPEGSVAWDQYNITPLEGPYASLRQHVCIVFSIKDPDDLNNKWQLFKKLHAQFGDNRLMKFLFVLPKKLDLPDDKTVKMTNDIFVTDAFIPLSSDSLILIDSNHAIRGHYAVKDAVDLQKLVRHTAIVLPLKKHTEVELIRKKSN